MAPHLPMPQRLRRVLHAPSWMQQMSKPMRLGLPLRRMPLNVNLKMLYVVFHNPKTAQQQTLPRPGKPIRASKPIRSSKPTRSNTPKGPEARNTSLRRQSLPSSAPRCGRPATGRASSVLRRVVLVPLLVLSLALATALTTALVLPAPAAADFSGVDYTLTNQNEQDFSGQDLANTSFAGASGRHANFSGADLHGAILTQAAFPEANFAGADLSGTLMDKVDFSGVDLTGAILSGAIASGSSFRGATVTNADFTDALIDRVDQRSLCRDAEGTNPVTGADTRTSLGC